MNADRIVLAKINIFGKTLCVFIDSMGMAPVGRGWFGRFSGQFFLYFIKG